MATRMAQYSLSPPARPVQISTYQRFLSYLGSERRMKGSLEAYHGNASS